ncbi:MAG: ATP-binding cassette domain-containing protein [Ruminococcaceae bacterium]|nr:ATP-binding cassette domain-containing protein [Oscillospiraceae bacterium]
MNIVITDLCKSYGEKQVLQNFNATIEAGKTTALMGASGIGKTTLANILLALEQPDSGTITGLTQHKSAVFQEDRLSENYSALTNVQAVCKNKADKEKAKNILCRLGLEKDLKTQVRSLSGGMKRRVALARALCAEYDFLVLDEPFKGLDEQTKEATMQTVKEMTQGKTVLLITHDKDEAQFFTDTIINPKE